MAGYVTVNRLSRIQLTNEDRKQQAHLKKINEMQRRSALDTSKPTQYPHITHHFDAQSKERKKQLTKENDFKLRKLLSIMKTKTVLAPPSTTTTTHQSTSPTRRQQQAVRSTQNDADHHERIANAKGLYHVREWVKDYEIHKEHLKLTKNSKLFTPCDMAINRQKGHTNSKRTPLTSSRSHEQH